MRGDGEEERVCEGEGEGEGVEDGVGFSVEGGGVSPEGEGEELRDGVDSSSKR